MRERADRDGESVREPAPGPEIVDVQALDDPRAALARVAADVLTPGGHAGSGAERSLELLRARVESEGAGAEEATQGADALLGSEAGDRA